MPLPSFLAEETAFTYHTDLTRAAAETFDEVGNSDRAGFKQRLKAAHTRKEVLGGTHKYTTGTVTQTNSPHF